jgi:hypothetical protein
MLLDTSLRAIRAPFPVEVLALVMVEFLQGGQSSATAWLEVQVGFRKLAVMCIIDNATWSVYVDKNLHVLRSRGHLVRGRKSFVGVRAVISEVREDREPQFRKWLEFQG